MLNKYITAVLLGCLALSAKAQVNIQQQITDAVKDAKGIVALTALNLETRDSISYHGDGQMVMQSVMKFPIALAVLRDVERGKFRLDERFKISDRDMHHKSGPLFEKYPKGLEIMLSELITYMVSYSDNNACDILLDKIGGVKPVMDNLRRLGVKGIVVDASELDMTASWEVQYTNWCKPAAMVQLLDVFYQGRALDKANTDTLMKKMLQTTTGSKQIKGLLPQGTVVAHKTGRSNTNAEGITAATNDVGIITLPNGQHLAVAIFIGNSTADLDTRESVIARLAKAVYDQSAMPKQQPN